MAIFLGFGAFVVVLALVAGVVRFRQRAARAREVAAEAALPAPRCDGCVHWDHDAGQRMLRSSPTFSQVMLSVSPNHELGTKVYATAEVADVEGTVTTRRYVEKVLPVWPAFENRWEYFGGCHADSVLVHRTSVCPKFQRRAVP